MFPCLNLWLLHDLCLLYVNPCRNARGTMAQLQILYLSSSSLCCMPHILHLISDILDMVLLLPSRLAANRSVSYYGSLSMKKLSQLWMRYPSFGFFIFSLEKLCITSLEVVIYCIQLLPVGRKLSISASWISFFTILPIFGWEFFSLFTLLSIITNYC